MSIRCNFAGNFSLKSVSRPGISVSRPRKLVAGYRSNGGRTYDPRIRKQNMAKWRAESLRAAKCPFCQRICPCAQRATLDRDGDPDRRYRPCAGARCLIIIGTEGCAGTGGSSAITVAASGATDGVRSLALRAGSRPQAWGIEERRAVQGLDPARRSGTGPPQAGRCRRWRPPNVPFWPNI